MSFKVNDKYIGLPEVTTAERLALTATNGMKVYDTTLNREYSYENGAWKPTITSGGSVAWGDITGTLSDQTDLQNALNAKQSSLGYTAEDTANKSTSVLSDQESDTKYPSVKSVYDWAVGAFQPLATVLTNTTASFTTDLKSSYDSAVSWITTNGTNLLNHLTNTSNPHSTTAAQVGAIASNSWIDYSATSTVVGWGSTTVKEINYIQVGNMYFFQVYISGTSNSATTTITLPINASSDFRQISYGVNNGNPCIERFRMTSGSNVVTFDLFSGISSIANFTATGTKDVYARFFLKV